MIRIIEPLYLIICIKAAKRKVEKERKTEGKHEPHTCEKCPYAEFFLVRICPYLD